VEEVLKTYKEGKISKKEARREPQSARGIKKSRRPDARGPRRNLETERSTLRIP
jgi:hypothetical protein